MRSSFAIAVFLALVGCDPATRSNLVLPETPPSPVQRSYLMSSTPAAEASAKRALMVAQKLYDANTQLGVRPTILTVGRPELEIFHDGVGGLRGCRVYLTEGLIQACKTEAELAAVLCVELGRIAAERAAQSDSLEQSRDSLDERVGNDSGGPFGSPDGTRVMELAKREKIAKGQQLKPDPTKCAAEYLRRANYPAQALLEVGPLLRQADESETIREVVQPAKLVAPIKATKDPTSRVGEPVMSVPETAQATSAPR
ncbi:MAG: hypothetical protein EBV06_00755 [Planctomycetia bacterium]|nr:hypothetical protein [Planctomycetia bacterium]